MFELDIFVRCVVFWYFKEALFSFVCGKQENTISVSNDNPVGREPTRLFAAGDSRAYEQPVLIALHTLCEFPFAERSRVNGPPNAFASRALIGWNLKTCQTEIR